MIDLLVVGRFRDQGVSLQTIRKVRAKLATRLRHAHPFSDQRLLTDGRSIFLETCTDIDDRRLEEVLSGQQAFREILLRYLREIDYVPETRLARRWRISEGVVLDPGRNFGKPTVDEFGIQTRVLAASFAANGENADLVADLYGVTPDAVRQAVQFERKVAA